MAIRCKREAGWQGHGGPTHLAPLPFAPSEVKGDLSPEVEAYLLATGFFEAVDGESEDTNAGGSVADVPAKSVTKPPRSKPFAAGSK